MDIVMFSIAFIGNISAIKEDHRLWAVISGKLRPKMIPPLPDFQANLYIYFR